MGNGEIKPYTELNIVEKQIIDEIRDMKLECDKAVFTLFSYKLTDLLNKYEDLLELRSETHALLFEVLDEIAVQGMSGIDVDYQKLGKNRQAEVDNIGEEISVVNEYLAAFNQALMIIDEGVAEEMIINEEK